MNRIRNRFAAKILVLSTLTTFLFSGFSPISAAEKLEATTAIRHKPIDYFIAGKRIVIEAEVSDKELVKLVRCYFRAAAEAAYVFVPMEAGNENTYKSILPAPGKTTPKLEYLFLVVNGKNQVVRSQVFTVDRKDQENTPPWQQSTHSGDIHVSTELPTAPETPQGFDDSIVMDTVESSARFGFVAENIYLGSQTGASAGAVDAAAATGTAAAASTTATAAAAGVTAGALTGAAATAASAGVVVATTGITTAAIVGAGAVVVAGGAVAAAAGGSGGGGGSSPAPPAPTPVVSPIPTPTSKPVPTPTTNPIPTPVVSPIPIVTPTPIPTPVPSDCTDLVGTWSGQTSGTYCDGSSRVLAMNMTIQSSCSWTSENGSSGTLSRSGNFISFQFPLQPTATNEKCLGALGTATFNGTLSTSGSSQAINGNYTFPAGANGTFKLAK